MRAHALLAVDADGRGGARPGRLRSDPPLVLRWTRVGPVLVAGAGGPLGGDELALDLTVAAAARTRVTSAAATVVQRGPAGGEARSTVRARLDGGSSLDWAPEPTVVCDGASWRARTVVDCAAGVDLRWREVLVLGRVGEPPGRARTELHVDVGGRPLLRQQTQAGAGAHDGWSGPAGTAGARVLGLVLVSRPGLGVRPRAHPSGWAVLPLAGPGVLVTALGDTTTEVDALLATGEALLPATAATVRP